jgi:hypothetical protein
MTIIVILSPAKNLSFKSFKVPRFFTPRRSVMKSSYGGTGFPACEERLAGAEARPTNLFML